MVSDRSFYRPTDLAISRANLAKAKSVLGWSATHQLEDIVKMTIAARLDRGRSTQ